MSIWVDRRAEVPGPGTHALIIGTSAYAFLPGGVSYPPDPNHGRTFDLQQVTIAARGAWRFAQWLASDEYKTTAKAPLKTLRLLLSPSASEKQSLPDLAALPANHLTTARQAVLDALVAWRNDCKGDRDGTAIFYITGHGVAKSWDDNYVLLEDFACNPLVMNYAVDPQAVYFGMVDENLPQTQLYFVDACRDQIDELRDIRGMGAPLGLDGPLQGRDLRACTWYPSTSPAGKSYGRSGEVTYFSSALLDCLSGEGPKALSPPDSAGLLPEQRTSWHISNYSLGVALKRRLAQIIDETNERDLASGAIRMKRRQTMVSDGAYDARLLTVWKQPPKLFIEIQVEPEAAAKEATAKLQDASNVVVAVDKPCVPRPLRFDGLNAGLYLLDVEVKEQVPMHKGPMVLTPTLPGIRKEVEFP